MSTIVTRAGKGSTLTFAEVDANFTNLNTDKLEFSSEPVRHSVRPSLLLDFANTKQLDPRITFTRASTATFYDGRTTAKAEENLLTFSEQIDNAAWILNTVSITANSTTAPDGTSTAELMTEGLVNARQGVYQSTITTLSSTNYIFSCYFKAGTRSFANLTLSTSTTVWIAAKFDLSLGTVASTNATSGNTVSGTIQSVGNGWYRCSVSGTFGTGGATLAFACMASDGVTYSASARGAETYLGTGSTVYIWGAQLEQRSSVTAYTPTTTAAITNYIPALQTAASGVARFDHNPTTGESLGLLIEEQRTNLVIRSQEFDSANWDAFGTKIVTANTNIAPDGTLTADTFSSPTGNGIYYSATTTANTIHTASLYCKAITGTQIRLVGVATSGAIYDTTITISSGQSVGNGWFRVQTTGTTATGDTFIQYRIYSADGKPVYIWGAQLEAGAFATSYIPTVASQVTRSPDAASMTGTNFSSWYRTDEGTMYGEVVLGPSTADKYICQISDNTVNNRYVVAGTNNPYQVVVSNGTTTVASNATGPFSNMTSKVASVYKVNDFAIVANAGTPVTDTLGALPVNVSQIDLGKTHFVGNFLNGSIKKFAFYPKRLTNAELQGLTTV